MIGRTFGSILFVGATLLLVLAPKGEGQALAGPTPDANLDRAAEKAAGKAAPTALANVGLKTPSAPAGDAIMAAGTTGSCPEGMLEVEGDYCPTLEQKCIKWMDPETTMPRRCSEFAPTGACQGKTTKKHFCIDRFEYPNRMGDKPVIFKTWYEAKDSCGAQGKRLCGDSEWTLACEGQERLPYPYGYQRNSEACNIDKSHPDVNEKALADPRTRDAEIARLWQGEPSGSRDSCVSPFGVMDMTGNVDEWVVNEGGQPFKSGLKGGYWGPVRDRCRPMTTAHNEQFAFYQIGFRCCSDVPGNATGTPKPSLPSAPTMPGKTVPSTNPPPGAPLAGS